MLQQLNGNELSADVFFRAIVEYCGFRLQASHLTCLFLACCRSSCSVSSVLDVSSAVYFVVFLSLLVEFPKCCGADVWL